MKDADVKIRFCVYLGRSDDSGVGDYAIAAGWVGIKFSIIWNEPSNQDLVVID